MSMASSKAVVLYHCSKRSRNQYDAHQSNTYARPNIPVHLDITFGTGELRGPQVGVAQCLSQTRLLGPIDGHGFLERKFLSELTRSINSISIL